MSILFFTFGIIIIPMIVAAVFLINGKGSFLIAGYNTMSKEKKEKYDEKYLCRFVGWLLIIISVLMLFMLASIYLDIEWLLYCIIALIIILPIGAVIYMNMNKRFRKSERGEKLCSEKDISTITGKKSIIAIIVISVIVLIGIGVLFYQGMKEPVINIHQNKVEISAMYGLTIDIYEIKNISLIEKNMNEIGVGRRINGFGGIGESLKGHFRSQDIGETLLFVQSKSSPTIRIERNNNKDIYISFRNGNVTLELYRHLLEFQLNE